jgi:glycosyltransferase involved in cell wall biosynthesis
MTRKNLLFITAATEIGGAEKSLILLIKGLEKSNFKSTVLLSCESTLSNHLKAESIEHYFLEGINWYRRHPRYLLPYVYKIARIAIKKKAKAIMSIIYTANKHCVLASKISRSRSVCYPHDLLEKEEFSYNLLGFTDILVAVSKKAQENYRSLSGPKQRIEMIYNAIDTQLFCRDNFDKSFIRRKGISEDEFIIGVVSAVWKPKGQHVMIQALPKILNEEPNIRLLIVGGSRDKNSNYMFQLHKMAWDLGVSNKVIFTGPVDDVRGVYGGLDLVVFPTLKEAFGMVLIEAMAMKVPVVASAVGGIPEIIENGVSGVLVPPEDPQALADAVIRLIRDKDLRRFLAGNGRQRVEEKFSIGEYITKSIDLFQKVCSGKLYAK